ncbi:MAG: hypothetical protein Phyf2KO_21580 [Phycisphaerales bacterium]
MTLLDPISTIVAFAIAAPLLVLLYFLKLRRRRLRVGSTLLWQRAVQDLQVNEPFRWLRVSSLLILQLLALALMTLALGRPAIPGAGISGDRVMLIIDRSASMSARDGYTGGTRFEEAIESARSTIEDLNPGTSIQILSFAAQPQIRLAPTTDHNAAIRALEQISPTDQPGNLAAAIELAESVVVSPASEDTTPTPPNVILFSDGGGSSSDLALAGAEIEFRRVGPPAADSYDNLGITHLNISSDYDDPSLSRVFLRVQNASSTDVASTISLRAAGNEVARKAVRVPGATPEGLGTQTVTFDLDRGFSGAISATINREDLLVADNTVHAIVAAAAKPRVVLITPGGDDPLDWVVRNALEEMDLADLRTLSDIRAEEILSSGSQLGADIVVLDRVELPEEVRGDVISFAADLPGIRLRTSDNSTDRFTSWSRGHPIMRGLTLDGIRISNPAWFEIDESTYTNELASGTRGPAIVLASEQGRRLLGIAFKPADTNWPLEISFYLFLAQAIEHFTFDAGAGNDTFATTTTRATIQYSGSPGEISLEGPTELNARVLRSTDEQSGRVSLGIPERAGVYTDGSGNPVLAVNMVLSEESGIATADTVRVGGRRVLAGGSADGHREIWHWFVIAAACVLTLEWLVFAERMRA